MDRPVSRKIYGLSLVEGSAFVGLLLIIAWLFGLYSRFPFDDEIYTFKVIEGFDLRGLLPALLAGYDVHPPASYMLFAFLAHLGMTPAMMRLVSLLLTGTGFLLILDATVAELPVGIAIARPLTIFLFATFPLLYGAGDALRWYPLLTALVAFFFWLDLKHGRPTIGGGLAIGLAASTNYIAALPYLAFAIRRYVLERRFSLKEDGPFHLALLSTAWPGVWTFISVVNSAGQDGRLYLSHAPVATGSAAIAQAMLGFFGGYRLGLIEAAVALPYVALLGAGGIGLVGALREERALATRRTTLIVSIALIAALVIAFIFLTGFGRGRDLLFVAPFMTSAMALGYWHLPWTKQSPLPLLMAAFLLFSGALANAHWSDDPFKRDLAIPFWEVEQFVFDNTSGDVLFASSESVSAHLMQTRGYCSVAWDDKPPTCMAQGLDQFRYIVLARNQNFEALPVLTMIEAYIRQNHTLVAKARFGRDDSATLKTKLTGTPLDPWLLDVEIYR